jgi:hypothetical protein
MDDNNQTETETERLKALQELAELGVVTDDEYTAAATDTPPTPEPPTPHRLKLAALRRFLPKK